jgi:hypothetical protein
LAPTGPYIPEHRCLHRPLIHPGEKHDAHAPLPRARAGTAVAFPGNNECSLIIASGPSGGALKGTFANLATTGSTLTFSNVLFDVAGAYSIAASCSCS